MVQCPDKKDPKCPALSITPDWAVMCAQGIPAGAIEEQAILMIRSMDTNNDGKVSMVDRECSGIHVIMIQQTPCLQRGKPLPVSRQQTLSEIYMNYACTVAHCVAQYNCSKFAYVHPLPATACICMHMRAYAGSCCCQSSMQFWAWAQGRL